MFAMEHYGVAADISTLAKSLAGGFPLSAVVGRAEVMDACAPGGLGGTYAGNPVACAAALAVLDVFEQEQIFARAGQAGRAADGAAEEARRAPSVDRRGARTRRDGRIRAVRGRRPGASRRPT